jgi:AcrR family transcriptional regulator
MWNLDSGSACTIRNHDSVCQAKLSGRFDRIRADWTSAMTTVTDQEPAATSPEPVCDRAMRADARRNRAAVMAAAKLLFAEQGLDAQMPDVAKQAKVGVGTVYRHFPTKDDLIAALVAQRFERLAQSARDALDRPDPWEGISDFIRFSAEIQAEDRGLCEVMGSRPEVMNEAAFAVGLPELCDRLIKRGQRSGQLRRDLTWEDIPMIACGLGRITGATVGPTTGRWPRLVEIILDGLRAPGSGKLPRCS